MTTAEGLGAVDRLADEVALVIDAPPRCHFFRTWRNRYAYDTNTGHILQLDPLSDAIARTLGRATFKETVRASCAEYGAAAVSECLRVFRSWVVETRPALLSTTGPTTARLHITADAYRAIVEHHLEHMVIVTTNKCNLACHYCTYSGKYPHRDSHSSDSMSGETLNKALKYFATHTGHVTKPHLGFYGGESTLAPDAVSHAVSYLERELKGRQYTLGMSTNLVDISTDMMRFLVEKAFVLYVSLDGPAYVHDRYRRHADGTGTFGEVIGNLKKLRDMAPDYYRHNVVILVTLAPPYRYDEVRRFFESEDLVAPLQCVVNEVDKPHAVFGDCTGGFFDKALLGAFAKEYRAQLLRGAFDGSQAPSFLNKLFDRAFLHLFRRIIRTDRFPDNFFPGGLCNFGGRKLYVRWDGALFPCERIPEYDDFQLGTVFDGFDVGKALRLYERYASLTETECRSCWAIMLCSGICVADCWQPSGPSRDMKLAKCEKLRGDTSDMLVIMCEILEENPEAFNFLNRYTIS